MPEEKLAELKAEYHRKRADQGWSRSLTRGPSGIDGGLGEVTRDGVGILNVRGPLFAESSFWSWVYDGTSYEELGPAMMELANNPMVREIVLNMNSPGGEVSGIDDFASMVAQVGKTKPVTAYVGGMAASGAYWIASQANRIVLSPIGEVGSIGVVVTMVDDTGYWESKGVKIYEKVSSQSPMKRPDMSTPEGEAEIQKMLDAMAEVFVGRVASGRNVSREKVLTDFGRGGMLVGEAAVTAGMADEVASTSVAAMRNGGKMGQPAMTAAQIREQFPDAVAEIERLAIENATPEVLAKTCKAMQTITESCTNVGREAGRSEGTAAERERIRLIETIQFSEKDAELVSKAKFVEPISAEKLAFQLAQASGGRIASAKADVNADGTAVPSKIEGEDGQNGKNLVAEAMKLAADEYARANGGTR